MLKKIIEEADGALKLIIENYYAKNNIEMDFEDAVTLGLFEDMVKKSESLITLLNHQVYTSIDIIARSIMEDYAYLKLLLSKENKIYGRSYFASTKIKEIKLYKRVTEKSRSGNDVRKLLGVSAEDISKKINLNDPDQEKEKIKEQFSDVFKKRTEKQKWYNLDGKTKNFEQLCYKLNLFAEYELLYRLLSNEAHSMDVMKRFRFKKNMVYVLNPSNKEKLHVSIVSKFLLESIDDLYNFYGFTKRLKNFRTKLSINYRLSK